MSDFDLRASLYMPALPAYLERVQAEIVRITETDNPSLSISIDRLIHAGGKRLRPSLLLAVVASQNQPIDKNTIRAAAAVELVHLASLVHDDVIDKAPTRWSLPTISASEGIGQAIVVGDFLLAKACETAATISAGAAELIAATITKLCDGQAYELDAQFNLDRSLDSLIKAVGGKTAALFATSCRLGGMCAGLAAKRLDAFESYGLNFGMGFQHVDDLLDFISTQKLAGKPVGNDVRGGVYTLSVLLALQSTQAGKLKNMLKNGKTPRTAVVNILIESGTITQTIQKIEDYNDAARNSLDSFAESEAIKGLKNLPYVYTKWAHNHLAAKRYRASLLKSRSRHPGLDAGSSQ